MSGAGIPAELRMAATVPPIPAADGWQRPATVWDSMPVAMQVKRCDWCGTYRHHAEGAGLPGERRDDPLLWVCRLCIQTRVAGVRARQANGEHVILDVDGRRWSSGAQQLGVLVDGVVLNRYQAASLGWAEHSTVARRRYRFR